MVVIAVARTKVDMHGVVNLAAKVATRVSATPKIYQKSTTLTNSTVKEKGYFHGLHGQIHPDQPRP